MSWKYFFISWLIGLGVFTGYSYFQSAPGFMDAEYYYGMGLRVAIEGNLSEPFIWNYLSPVNSIPHPGFTYWMPLPSFIAALGILITGLKSFAGAKMGFTFLAAFIPAITMKIAFDLSGRKDTAILASVMTIFPTFYSVFLGITDSFGLMMVLGGLFFLVSQKMDRFTHYLLLGGIAGLMHLTRTDGLIWLLVGIYLVFLSSNKKCLSVGLTIAGYLVIMGPWFLRNWLVFNSLMPVGTTAMFWLTEYNDLFSLDVSKLSFRSWIGQGFGKIAVQIGNAALANIKTGLFVQGQVMLLPFMVVGIYRNKNQPGVKVSFYALGIFYLIMTVIFPFAGMRGGFLHSGAAFQPLLWALGGCGFQEVISWGEKMRGWQKNKAGFVFGATLVVFMMGITGVVFSGRVIGKDLQRPIWNESYRITKVLALEIDNLGIDKNALILINNPPGYFAAVGKSSIVIPNGNVNVLLAAAKQFDAEAVVLEENHPAGLDELYLNPTAESRLIYLGSKNGTHFFSVP